MGKIYYQAPSADVIGDVSVGKNSSIWYQAVVRGDSDRIQIGEKSNVQDGCILHTDKGQLLSIGDGVTVGHAAILHGCEIGDNSLIGMGAIVLNGAKIGKNSIVGAGALVTQGKEFPDGVLLIGSPAKAVRPLNEEEIESNKEAALHYVEHAKEQLQEKEIC